MSLPLKCLNNTYHIQVHTHIHTLNTTSLRFLSIFLTHTHTQHTIKHNLLLSPSVEHTQTLPLLCLLVSRQQQYQPLLMEMLLLDLNGVSGWLRRSVRRLRRLRRTGRLWKEDSMVRLVLLLPSFCANQHTNTNTAYTHQQHDTTTSTTYIQTQIQTTVATSSFADPASASTLFF